MSDQKFQMKHKSEKDFHPLMCFHPQNPKKTYCIRKRRIQIDRCGSTILTHRITCVGAVKGVPSFKRDVSGSGITISIMLVSIGI